MAWDETSYRWFFREVNGFAPYGFQVDVARRLIEGENLVLRAPTGAGKTATVLTPFLYCGWWPRPGRLIYALPVRTLAQSIYRTAREMVARLRYDPETTVTMQTGDQPDDPFFTRGRVIVATYDQVLSGLLHGPYGLPGKLHNVNAAAIAGTLVVFDEFHLMEPQRAFLTGAAGLHLFRGLAQSVWMTATATSPLAAELAQALDARACGPSDADVASLPSVENVTRKLVWEPKPLAAETVANFLDGRTIVIANTVGHAQAIFKRLGELRPDVPRMLLHSRFFKGDRQEKEAQLKKKLGKGSKGPMLLVATQVVEVGVDISGDHLFTDLAPMNSLVQRFGRCARFEGEVGTVHVHPLPDEPRAWLPYGDLSKPDPALEATEGLLTRAGTQDVELTPTVAAEWVGQVHATADRWALSEGWRGRLGTVVTQISQTAVDRMPSRVSHLIREPSTDEMAVILARPDNLPDRPGRREAIKLSRWRVADAVKQAAENQRLGGWVWDTGDQPGWVPLRTPDQLADAFAVALDPAVACYTKELGVELGEPGTEQSPDRTEPRRPGHSPLHAEPWTAHTQAVAEEAKRRLERDDGDGWLGQALERRYGIGPVDLRQAIHACGAIHDLGKLQKGWQDWAAEYQGLRDPQYRHLVALAHTDFDPNNPGDRERDRRVTTRRPEHSVASAYVGAAILGRLLADVQSGVRGRLASACVAAVLAHHGGWLGSEGALRQDLGLQPLWKGAGATIDQSCGRGIGADVVRFLGQPDRRRRLGQLLEATTGAEALRDWWPLVAYLTRTLRLADQRATAEGGKSE